MPWSAQPAARPLVGIFLVHREQTGLDRYQVRIRDAWYRYIIPACACRRSPRHHRPPETDTVKNARERGATTAGKRLIPISRHDIAIGVAAPDLATLGGLLTIRQHTSFKRQPCGLIGQAKAKLPRLVSQEMSLDRAAADRHFGHCEDGWTKVLRHLDGS
ncbi:MULTISPECIES: hypothetical protein [Streptomyces]